MNLVQQQNDLKNFSDQQLQQIMQAGDGSVPPFLVLGEMDRRARMRQEYGGGGQPGGRTVADDVMGGLPALNKPSVMPQAGMMGPPQPQMSPMGPDVGNMGGPQAPDQPQQPTPPVMPSDGGLNDLEPQGYAGGGLVEDIGSMFIPSLAVAEHGAYGLSPAYLPANLVENFNEGGMVKAGAGRGIHRLQAQHGYADGGTVYGGQRKKQPTWWESIAYGEVPEAPANVGYPGRYLYDAWSWLESQPTPAEHGRALGNTVRGWFGGDP